MYVSRYDMTQTQPSAQNLFDFPPNSGSHTLGGVDFALNDTNIGGVVGGAPSAANQADAATVSTGLRLERPVTGTTATRRQRRLPCASRACRRSGHVRRCRLGGQPSACREHPAPRRTGRSVCGRFGCCANTGRTVMSGIIIFSMRSAPRGCPRRGRSRDPGSSIRSSEAPQVSTKAEARPPLWQ